MASRVRTFRYSQGSSGNCVITLPIRPSVGNALIIYAAIDRNSGQTVGGCTDNNGNSYLETLAVNGRALAGVWCCSSLTATAGGASFQITIQGSGSSGIYWETQTVEYSGVGTGLVLDQFVKNTGNSATPTTGTTAALTGSESLQAACFAIDAAQGSITVGTATPSWTEEFESLTFINQSGEADSRIAASTAGTTPSCSWTATNSNIWAAVLVVFKSTATLVIPPPVGITRVITAEWAIGSTGGTSAPIDTFNATFLVISVSSYGQGSISGVSDSKGNTWYALTSRVTANAVQRLYYATPAITAPNHTFTVTGSNCYPYMALLAYSGFNINPESENGATSTGTSPQATGSVTPTQNGSLIISGWAGMNAAINPAVSAGLTIQQFNNSIGSVCISGAVADLIQATAAPINPIWSWSGTDNVAETIAVFREFTDPPTSRVTQDVVEVLITPTPLPQITQDVVEVLSAGTPLPRVTQSVVEVLSSWTEPPNTITQARVSQFVVEVAVVPPFPDILLSQLAVEVAYLPASNQPVRLSQLAVEVLILPSDGVSTQIWMGDGGGLIWIE